MARGRRTIVRAILGTVITLAALFACPLGASAFAPIRELSLPSSMTEPTAITVAPTGEAWFTAGAILVRVGTAGQVASIAPPNAGARPDAVVADEDDSIWFGAGRLGKV